MWEGGVHDWVAAVDKHFNQLPNARKLFQPHVPFTLLPIMPRSLFCSLRAPYSVPHSALSTPHFRSTGLLTKWCCMASLSDGSCQTPPVLTWTSCCSCAGVKGCGKVWASYEGGRLSGAIRAILDELLQLRRCEGVWESVGLV